VPVAVALNDPVRPLDRGGGRGLQEQLEQRLRTDIRAGTLGPGERVPSTRELAAALGVSRGVVAGAYAQLVAEGYLVTRQGAPHRVSSAIRGVAPRPEAQPLASGFAYDLRPGPDPLEFPRGPWTRAMAEGLRAAPSAVLSDLDPRGVPQVRDALAAYLDRIRGTAADPEFLVLCAGFAQGFSLLCRCLVQHGVERIAVEDPGYHQHRLAAVSAGLDVVPIPVDSGGLSVEALDASGAMAVVVTPSHQFPTGSVLDASRRAALTEWAERRDGLIVEDDYDSELRFDGVAVGAVQGLAPERVVHIGSASKRLAPGLRLGWMVVPSWLIWSVVSAKAVEDRGSEVLGQLALASLIGAGHLDRHLRRMRSVYARRRAALLAALADLPLAAGSDPAGLVELVTLPEAVDEASFVAAAAARGVGLEGLATHRMQPSGPGGVLVSYAALPEPALARAVALLGDALVGA
jgi:GntR family transcriptional regulator/MocR family aminotransferase